MYGTIDEKQPLAGGHAPSHGATTAHVSAVQGSIWLLLVVQVACCVIMTSVGHIGVMVSLLFFDLGVSDNQFFYFMRSPRNYNKVLEIKISRTSILCTICFRGFNA